MVDELVVPLAEWELGLLRPERVPALAVAALERGCEVAEVAVLAGMDCPLRRDVEDELARLLSRLGLPRPSRMEALKTVVDACAESMIAESLAPADGAHRLWRLANEAGFGGPIWMQLRAFVGLASEWDDHPDSREFYEAQILGAAAQLISSGGLRLD